MANTPLGRRAILWASRVAAAAVRAQALSRRDCFRRGPGARVWRRSWLRRDTRAERIVGRHCALRAAVCLRRRSADGTVGQRSVLAQSEVRGPMSEESSRSQCARARAGGEGRGLELGEGGGGGGKGFN